MPLPGFIVLLGEAGLLRRLREQLDGAGVQPVRGSDADGAADGGHE